MSSAFSAEHSEGETMFCIKQGLLHFNVPLLPPIPRCSYTSIRLDGGFQGIFILNCSTFCLAGSPSTFRKHQEFIQSKTRYGWGSMQGGLKRGNVWLTQGCVCVYTHTLNITIIKKQCCMRRPVSCLHVYPQMTETSCDVL